MGGRKAIGQLMAEIMDGLHVQGRCDHTDTALPGGIGKIWQ